MALLLLANSLLLLFFCASAKNANPHGHSIKQRSAAQLAVNSTLGSSPNASSIVPSQFSFIIPYDNKQACDIYGPICQTGSITVGVNLTSATSTTVLPCSSYLTAQSSHLGQAGNFEVLTRWPWDWQIGFGRSPQCRAYAQGFNRQRYTFSDCGNNNTVVHPEVIKDYPKQMPPSVLRYFSPTDTGFCCGNCTLGIPEVKLYYFPDNTTTECAYNQTANSTSFLSAGTLGKRMQSLVGDGSIAVVSGHTFTSPSLYLQIVGTATASDQCGKITPAISDSIITLAPGQLSTWRPPPLGQFQWDNFTIGEEWRDWSSVAAVGDPGFLAPLNVRDLACPTWGLGRTRFPNGTVVTTIGPPFLPLIGPVMQAFSLDPNWSAACTALLTGMFVENSFEIYDPPTVLIAGTTMKPAFKSIAAIKPQVTPADPITTPDPQVTSFSGPARPASPIVHTPPVSTNVGISKGKSIGSRPSSEGAPPSPGDVTVDTDAQSHSSMADPAAGAGNHFSDHATRLLGNLDSAAGTTAPAAPTLLQGDGSGPQTQGIAAIIYSALGKSEAGDVEASTKVNSLPVPSSGVQLVNVPGGSQVLSIEPSAVVLEGTTYSAGGPAMTLSDSIFTMVPEPDPKDSASVLYYDPSKTMPHAPDPLTVAGQPVVINPSDSRPSNAISFSSASDKIGDNTVVKLDPSGASGASATGGNTFTGPLEAATQTSAPTVSALSIAGTTISAGNAAITVNGTLISLQPSGTLIVGSSTVLLSVMPSSAVLLPISGVPSSTTSDADGSGVLSQSQSSLAVIDSVKLTAGGPGVTVSGSLVSLESGGKTLDVGSGRLATPTGPGLNMVPHVLPIKGGQEKVAGLSIFLMLGSLGCLLLLL